MPGFPIPKVDLSLIEVKPLQNRYFVVFSSRRITPTVPTSLGHVFVTWGSWDYGAAACTSESYGLYAAAPIGQVLLSPWWGKVPGEIEDEQLNGFQSVGSIINSLVVEVNQNAWSGSEDNTHNMLGTPQPYQLGTNDCVTWIQMVAGEMGLNLPPRTLMTTFPVDYVAALKTSATSIQTFDFPFGHWVGPSAYEHPSGYGTYTDPADGSTWVGAMYDYVKVGPGVWTIPGTGEFHVSGFDALGNIIGHTVIYQPDGTIFTGTFVSGKAQGQGSLVFPDKTGASGNFVDGTLQGQGVFTSPNGTSWVGPFVNGFMDGTGWYYDGSGHNRFWLGYSKGQSIGLQPPPPGVNINQAGPQISAPFTPDPALPTPSQPPVTLTIGF